MGQFLKPNIRKIITFGVLLFIAYAGGIQAWAFCKDCGIPKPFLYDAFSPFPFWAILMYLLLPVFMVDSLISGLTGRGFATATYLFGGNFWLDTTVIAVYFYCLACAVNYLWRRGKQQGAAGPKSDATSRP